MTSLSVDELFARYQASGRPVYLARVFDATAPELLRVAMHTCKDPARAEDLVQNTFVAAIRSVRRFETGARVLPWLLGILGNLALEQKRDDARRPDAERLGRVRPVEPSALAEERELDEAVGRALDELDEPYRAVLALHLRHGLGPAEIASALGRAPGTVRSQLARGLERLRGRLPRGFVGGLALTLCAGRGLPAMRRAIVARAAVAAPWIAAHSIVGGVAAHPVLTTAAAALAIALIGLSTSWSSSEPAAGTRATSTGDVTSSESPRPGAALASPPSGRERVAEADAARVDTGALAVALTPPVEGVVVAVHRRPATDAILNERRARTDRHGVARFDGLRPGDYTFRLAHRDGSSTTVAAGAETEVAVVLDGGVAVRGRVVDDAGRPIGGASIWLARGGFADFGLVATRSDPTGSFALEGVAADRAVAAFAPGHLPCAPVEVGADVELVLPRGAAGVHGRVVDERGRPITGAHVQVGREGPPFWVIEPDGSGRRWVSNRLPVHVCTDEHGRYAAESVRGGGPVHVFARSAGRVGSVTSVQVSRSGSTRHDIVLRRGGSVTGRITTRGEPMAGLLVRAGRDDASSPGWMRPLARTDGAGGYRLDGVAPGVTALQVHSASLGRLATRVDVVAGAATAWNADFRQAPRLRGRVVDASGVAQVGLHVDVHSGRSHRVPTDERGAFSLPLDERRAERLVVSDRRFAVPVVVWSGDARASLDRELELTVPVTGQPGSLALSVRDERGGPGAGAVVRLRSSGELAEWKEFVVDDDGALFVAALRPGGYELRVCAPGRAEWIRRFDVEAARACSLPPIVLERGGRCQLHYTIDGRVPEQQLRLVIRRGGEVVYDRSLLDGDHRTPRLAAGEYRLRAWTAEHAVFESPLTVVTDRTSWLAFDASGGVEVDVSVRGFASAKRTRSVRATWFREDGREVCDDNYFADAADSVRFRRRLAPGTYVLQVDDELGRRVREAVTVGATRVEVRVVMR